MQVPAAQLTSQGLRHGRQSVAVPYIQTTMFSYFGREWNGSLSRFPGSGNLLKISVPLWSL